MDPIGTEDLESFVEGHPTTWPPNRTLQHITRITEWIVGNHEAGLGGGWDPDQTKEIRDICIDLVIRNAMTSDENVVFLCLFDTRDTMFNQLRLLLPHLKAVRSEADFTVELREKAVRLLQRWNLQGVHLLWIHSRMLSRLHQPERIRQMIPDVRKFPDTPIEFASDGAWRDPDSLLWRE